MKTVKGEIRRVELEIEYKPEAYILNSVGKYLEDLLEGIGYTARVNEGKLILTYRGPAKDYEASKQIIDNTVNLILEKLLDLNRVVKSRADLDLLRHEKGEEAV